MGLLLVLTVFVISGCSSAGDAARRGQGGDSAGADVAESFIQRPYFRDVQARPLERILLSWDTVPDIDGYLLQMSLSPDFSSLEKSWTIRGQNLELPLNGSSRHYFRIRAFKGAQRSRWSSTLEVLGADLR